MGRRGVREPDPIAACVSVQLPTGVDSAIDAMQDVLVTLGYLDQQYADGPDERCDAGCRPGFPVAQRIKAGHREQRHAQGAVTAGRTVAGGGLMRRVVRAIAPWLAVASVVPACSQASRGSLSPVAGPGVTRTSTGGLPGDTARLSGGGVTADVTGRWSDRNETIEIRYRAGPATVRIAMQRVATGKARVATSAWDRTKPFPGNAIGRPLLDAAPLAIAAGGEAHVQVEFARGTRAPLSIGDEVTLAVPMPDGIRPVRFRVGGE